MVKEKALKPLGTAHSKVLLLIGYNSQNRVDADMGIMKTCSQKVYSSIKFHYLEPGRFQEIYNIEMPIEQLDILQHMSKNMEANQDRIFNMVEKALKPVGNKIMGGPNRYWDQFYTRLKDMGLQRPMTKTEYHKYAKPGSIHSLYHQLKYQDIKNTENMPKTCSKAYQLARVMLVDPIMEMFQDNTIDLISEHIENNMIDPAINTKIITKSFVETNIEDDFNVSEYKDRIIYYKKDDSE